MGPGFRRYRMHTSLPASSAIAYTLRPATAGRGRGPTRQRWEREGRPVPWCSAQVDRGAARESAGSLAQRRGEERDNRDAPHPPIASQWAPPSPRFAGERCMGGASPRHGGPKMCESDSGLRRDDGISSDSSVAVQRESIRSAQRKKRSIVPATAVSVSWTSGIGPSRRGRGGRYLLTGL